MTKLLFPGLRPAAALGLLLWMASPFSLAAVASQPAGGADPDGPTAAANAGSEARAAATGTGNDASGLDSNDVLLSPVRIAVGPDGQFLVSDHKARKIWILHRESLAVVRSIDVDGKPLGVAFAEGRIYVGNETLGAVEVYTPSGKRKAVMGLGEERAGKPTDIAVDSEGRRLYVVDSRAKCVKVCHLDGEFLFTIPAVYPNASVLADPTGIAVDAARGELLVSDFGDGSYSARPRIQIFKLDGTHAGQISGKSGMLGARFSRPQGLAVDPLGRVVMTDSLSCEVFILDRATGQTLDTLGGFGLDPGQLRLPLDLVVDPDDGRILVTNNRSARIEVFPQGGPTP